VTFVAWLTLTDVAYVTGPSVLYVTGGAAFVHMRDTFGGNPLPAATAFTTTKTGWTLGGGLETKLSRNWSTKTEYLYVDAGSSTFAAPNTAASLTDVATFKNSFHVVKTGLNYKLDGNWEGLPFFGAPFLPSDHNWAGFYAGVNMGGGISLVQTTGGAGTVASGTSTDIPGTGFAGGGHVGYNYMLTRKWFAGVEGDIGYLGVSGSLNPQWNENRIFSEKTNWYATARARFGATTGPALLYVTGGGAWVNLTDGIVGSTGATDVSTATKGGWTIGGGTEVALNVRWSARLEYLYLDVGHRNHMVTEVIPNVIILLPNADFKERFQVVRVGLTYQFGN
jgi:outer membrane immunogenic protein